MCLLLPSRWSWRDHRLTPVTTLSPSDQTFQPGRQFICGMHMEIGSCTFNTAVVRGVPNEHGGDPRRTRGLHVERGVTQIPDVLARSEAKLFQCHQDRCRVRLVRVRVARADHGTKMPGPTEVDD